MAKAKILRTDAELFIVEQYMADIEKMAHVVTADSDDADTLCALARDADLILTCYAEIPAPVIEASAKLKGIVKYGVGTNNIDVDCATRRGVMVVNCPDYGSDTVADHAFALMISLARKIPVLDRVMRDGAWAWPTPDRLGLDLAGKTMGIIGMGRIGRAMARRAAGFSMEIISTSPYEQVCPVAAEFVPLDELLARSDFLSIHSVLTPETRGLLGAAELKAMKSSALILINVSRGADRGRGRPDIRLERRLDRRRRAGCVPRRTPRPRLSPARHGPRHPHPAPGLVHPGSLRTRGARQPWTASWRCCRDGGPST